MSSEDTGWAVIDALLHRQQSFAIYRLPEEKTLHLLTQEGGDICLLKDLQELNGQKGFVIAPFRIEKDCPVVLIRPGQSGRLLSWEESGEGYEDVRLPLEEEESFGTSPSGSYAACFRTFIRALREKRFDKLVLSRSLTVEKPRLFSPSDVFRAACRRYRHSYIYLCYTPSTGMWMGSTPEIILSGEKDNWHTVALAGTQPLQGDRLPQVWDEKNRKEQEYVSSYIRNQLLSLDICPSEEGPYPAYAGALSHLKTDFRFSLCNRSRLGELLERLHPTPAVCGLPKETAYRFIEEHEGYDRRYYSGFIGWLDPDGKTELYVNLRCMYIGEDRLTLYAGGGLLDSSDLEDEWLETEKKLQTMKRLLYSVPH